MPGVRHDCCREVGRPEVAGETHGGESGEAPQGEHGADRVDGGAQQRQRADRAGGRKGVKTAYGQSAGDAEGDQIGDRRPQGCQPVHERFDPVEPECGVEAEEAEHVSGGQQEIQNGSCFQHGIQYFPFHSWRMRSAIFASAGFCAFGS